MNRLERTELKHEYKCARREAKAQCKEMRREAKAERQELRHEYRCARRQARHGFHHSHSHFAHFHGHCCGNKYGPGFGGQGFGPTGFGRGYGPGLPRRPGEGHTFVVGAVSRVIGWGKQAVQQATQSHNRGPQQQQGQAGYYPREEQQEYQHTNPGDMEKGVASGSAPAQRQRGNGGDEKRHHSDEDGEWEDVGYDSEETAVRVPDEPLPPYEAVARRS